MAPNFFSNKKKLLNVGLSLVHAIFLLIVTLIYLAISFTLDDEIVLIQATSSIKNKLFQQKRRPDTERFLLVNVAWDKKLIPKKDTIGNIIGNQPITNRESLAKVLNKINQFPDNHEFILVDINFIDPSPDDSLLELEFNKIKRCLVSYHKNAKGEPVIPIVKAPISLSDMQVDDEERDLILKYHLIQGDSLKTTPLRMNEIINGKMHEKGLIYDKIGGKRSFNSFILDYPMDKNDIFNRDLYRFVNIQELVNIPPPFLAKMVKDKIVIFGDFEDRDIHNTIYGKMPGPLILINAFLALERGDNEVSPYFLLLLLIAYTLISYKAITVRDPITKWVERKFKDYNFVVEFTVDVTFYLIYFGIVSIISYWFFQIHLTILFLSFYMHFLEVGIKTIAEKKEEKKLKAESSKEA